MRTRHLVPLLLALALAAMPAAAYTIFLKDGSKIEARAKYTVEDDTAYFVLNNGTQSFLPLEEIDAERTESANQSGYSSALVLENGRVSELRETPPVESNETLSDLIARGEAADRPRTEARAPSRRPARREAPAREAESVEEARAPAPAAWPDAAAVEEVKAMFAAGGLAETEVWTSGVAGRPQVAVLTPSEAAVFRALRIAAEVVRRVDDEGERAFDSVELTLATEGGGSGGRFVLTPEDAGRLASGEVEVSRFFVEEVQF